MATRAQQAASSARRTAQLEALKVLDGEPLPLPTEPRPEPIPYSDDLPAEAVALGSQGLSEVQIAAHWAISAETMQEWGKTYPSFSQALARARTAMRAWWEEKARRALVTSDNRFPAGAWAQVMRARFSEYDDKSGINVHIDLGRLVVVNRNAPELPTEQTVIDAKPLTDQRTVRLAPGQTLEDGSDEARYERPQAGTTTGHDGDV